MHKGHCYGSTSGGISLFLFSSVDSRAEAGTYIDVFNYRLSILVPQRQNRCCYFLVNFSRHHIGNIDGHDLRHSAKYAWRGEVFRHLSPGPDAQPASMHGACLLAIGMREALPWAFQERLRSHQTAAEAPGGAILQLYVVQVVPPESTASNLLGASTSPRHPSSAFPFDQQEPCYCLIPACPHPMFTLGIPAIAR